MKFTERELLDELKPNEFWQYPHLVGNDRYFFGHDRYRKWDNALLFFATAKSPARRGLVYRFSFEREERRRLEEDRWTSFHRRIEPLRQTVSGTKLLEYYRSFFNTKQRHKHLSEQEEADHRKLMTVLWVSAHEEAGLLEDSEPILEALGRDAEEAVALIQERMRAERELEKSRPHVPKTLSLVR